VKRYRTWKDNEVSLAKKREVKVRLELAHKTDKIAEASRDIAEVSFELKSNESTRNFCF
jgi:hypothetical protein